MSFKSLLALPLAAPLVLFLTGSAFPYPSLSPAPAFAQLSPAQKRETVVAPARCPDEQNEALTRASRCDDQAGPIIIKVDPATRRRTTAASCHKAPCVPPPPVPSCPKAPCSHVLPCQPMSRPRPLPEREHPTTHTLTITNGAKEVQHTFVQQDGSWQNCGDVKFCDVFFRDCSRSPWRLYGTYSSRRAEEVACSLRANGNLTSVRPHSS
jgi:hypothetical protein